MRNRLGKLHLDRLNRGDKLLRTGQDHLKLKRRFAEAPLDSSFFEIASRVLVISRSSIEAIGTAFLVGGNFAITAKHVIEEINRKYGDLAEHSTLSTAPKIRLLNALKADYYCLFEPADLIASAEDCRDKF